MRLVIVREDLPDIRDALAVANNVQLQRRVGRQRGDQVLRHIYVVGAYHRDIPLDSQPGFMKSPRRVAQPSSLCRLMTGAPRPTVAPATIRQFKTTRAGCRCALRRVQRPVPARPVGRWSHPPARPGWRAAPALPSVAATGTPPSGTQPATVRR